MILQCPAACPMRHQLCQLLLPASPVGGGSPVRAHAVAQLLPLMRGGDGAARAVAEGLRALCDACPTAQLDAAFERAKAVPVQVRTAMPMRLAFCSCSVSTSEDVYNPWLCPVKCIHKPSQKIEMKYEKYTCTG